MRTGLTAVICAAGSGSRWGNYTGRRKHMALIDGEAGLARIVRQLRERRVDDIVITHTAEHPYVVEGARSVEVPSGLTHMQARRHTATLWNQTGPTLLLLGDVYFSDRAMDALVMDPEGPFVQFGRLRKSVATGKPGAEMFGWRLPAAYHGQFLDHIAEVEYHGNLGVEIYNDWGIYTVSVGHGPAVHPDKILNWGNHVEIEDDGTDDFDFADDYERWMLHMRKRSARRVRAGDFWSSWFLERRVELGLKETLHRKPWEFASIAQAFIDRFGSGVGRTVLGFGVGKEPLPAWFARQGAMVLATDRPEAGLWLERQHAVGFGDLKFEGICSAEEMANHVVFAPLDMNHIPSSAHGKNDFTWSASCFEHLGGIEAGLKFFCEQMKCLKPGGVAAHTTEYVTNSNDVTLNGENLCLFRQQDLDRLAGMLEAQGDRLWTVDARPGNTYADAHIDKQPFQLEPHLNLELAGVQFTSVLLIAMRGHHAV